MQASVAGIGVIGPGLDGWTNSARVLRGEEPYVAREVELEPPASLSSRERRRAGLTVRLSLNAAAEAVAQSGLPANALAPVFGTANGDGQTIHRLLDALARPDRIVSPTLFHNSVHNAAVGYWAIGVSSRKPSTCIAAHDFTFAATLVKALAHVECEREAVLMAVYDAPFPEPLNGARPMAKAPFGMALVLTPVRNGAGGMTLALAEIGAGRGAITPPHPEALHDLWTGNPAARALPVLSALARQDPSTVTIAYPGDGHVRLDLVPC